MSSSKLMFNFNPQRIIKEGYMVKSPPLDDETFIKRRWRMRWFVLCYVDGEVMLFYFRDEKHRKQEKVKGRIPLVGAEVYKQHSRMHGYPYVINIQTNDRLYHLCATQLNVHEDWLESIRDHYIPNTELIRQYKIQQPCCRIADARPSLTAEEILCEAAFERCSSITSRTSVTSHSDEEYEYDHPTSNISSTGCQSNGSSPRQQPCPGIYNTSLPRPPRALTFCSDKDQSSPLYENIGHRRHTELRDYTSCPSLHTSRSSQSFVPAFSEIHEAAEDTSYVTMHSVDDDVKRKSTTIESEDEGIGRSDSDSSGTSSITNCAQMTNLLQAALRSSLDMNEAEKDIFLGGGFVGPKMTSSTRRTGSTS